MPSGKHLDQGGNPPVQKRERLPDRRDSESHSFSYQEKEWTLSCTRIDGRVVEVFVTPPAHGSVSTSALADVSRDACVLISIALQYGVPLEVMRDAVTRDDRGGAASIAGRILDELCGGEN